MHVLVLGGTGVISSGIVTALLKENHEVSIFNRGKKALEVSNDVHCIVGDKSNRDEFNSTMRNRHFDAVIDMISFNREDAQTTVEAFRDRTDHLLITSSVAAYKRPYDTIPVVEDCTELCTDPGFDYAFLKAEMERYLVRLIQQARLPITIIRPSLTFGVGAKNIGVLRQNYGIVDRIRKGRPLIMFGDGTTPFSFTFVPDLARGYVGILGKRQAFGEAFHITSEERTLWRDLYLEMGRIVGKEPDLRYIPSNLLYRAAPNLCKHLYMEKTHPGLFDNGKIRTIVPGFRAEIDLSRGLETILEWWDREANTVDPGKDSLEDQLVEAHDSFAANLAGLWAE